MRPLKGVITAAATPFRSGAIDRAAWERLIERQAKAGVDWVLVGGTTGESPTLTLEERAELTRRARASLDGVAGVMTGVGTNCTATSVEQAKAAVDAGAEALLVVVPYYNRPTPSGLAAHFATVAEAARDRPVMLYNVPGRTGLNPPVSVFVEAAAHENVVAVKEAAADPERVSELRARCRLDVLSGNDSLTLAMMAMGAAGVVSVASNVAPEAVCALVRRAASGDFAGALAEHERLWPLMKALFVETNPTPLKCALSMMGLCENELRPPLAPAVAETVDLLRRVLADLGLLRDAE